MATTSDVPPDISSRIQTADGAAFEPRGTFDEHVIYWPELGRLQKGATIDVYLPLLTERRVRERVHHGERSD